MPPLPPPDDGVPGLHTVLGVDARHLLNTAFEPSGLEVLAATPVQTRYSPGRYIVVQYRAETRDRDGRDATPTLIASTGLAVPEGTPRVSDGNTTYAVWRFPNDPFLPGLAAAVNVERVKQLLHGLGVATSDRVRTRARAYRASRRAVVEVTSGEGTNYLKVVRPSKVAALQQRHVALAPHLPIPPSLGWTRDGIVVMEALQGDTLRHEVESGRRELPSADELVAILDRMPSALDTRVAGPAARAKDHAKLLRAVLPEAAEEVIDVVDAIADTDPPHSAVPVHGDFHSSQVLVTAGRIVGLVDVDTAGIGERIDDLANMLGHLATLTVIGQPNPHVAHYLATLRSDFERRIDPGVLAKRTAAVILGLATGPFRVQLAAWPDETWRRIGLAKEWAEDGP